MEQITKHSEKELSITKSVVEIISKDTLISEKEHILGSIGNYTNSISKLEERIAEIDALLGEAVKLGIKTESEVAELLVEETLAEK